jgi:hypothetical protein
MTREELKLKRNRAALKARRDIAADPVVEEVIVEEEFQPYQDERGNYIKTAPNTVTGDEVRGLGQTLLNEQLMGGGDEVVGAVRALADPQTPYDFGEGVSMETQSLPKAYEMYRSDAESAKDQFADDNPKTAIAGSLAGAIANPLNKIPLGATGTTAKVIESIARGGAEGAAGGFLENEEDRMGGAGIGGGTGATLSGVLSGVGGGLGRALSKRRIAEDLLKPDGSFLPANLADPEGNVGRFAKEWVGGSWGGRNKQGILESEWLNANPQLADLADEAGQVVPVTAGTRNAVKGRIGDIAEEGVTQTRVLKQSLEDIKDATARNQSVAERTGAMRLVEDAIPDRVPAKVRADILGRETTEDANKALGKWWKDNGFETVKNRDFKWDGSLIADLKRELELDPELALEVGGKVGGLKRLDSLLQPAGSNVQRGITNQKWQPIGGEDLMALRNAFAKTANKGGASASGSGNRSIADKFDDMIAKQLGEGSDELAAYQDDLRRWSTRQPIAKASKANKVSPNATPKEILKQFRDGPSAEVGRDIARDANNQVQAVRDEGASLLKKAKAQIDEIPIDTKAAKRRLNEASTGALPESQTVWSGLASTATLGALPVALTGGALAPAILPLGYGMGKALSSKAGNRAIAGQLPAQEMLAKALRDGDLEKYTRLLSRYGAMSAAE